MPCFARIAFLLLVLGAPCVAADDPSEKQALLVTIRWDDAGPSVEKIEKRELAVPMQRGFPQLWTRFFEVRDPQDNVHYAGPLVDPRAGRKPEPGVAPGSTFRVLVPDLPEARRLVIVERVPAESVDKTRKVLKDVPLEP